MSEYKSVDERLRSDPRQTLDVMCGMTDIQLLADWTVLCGGYCLAALVTTALKTRRVQSLSSNLRL